MISNALSLSVVLSFLIVNNITAMPDCKCTLGDIYQNLKSIDYKYHIDHYEQFSGFDFSKFKPLEGQMNGDDFYKIGFDSLGKIVEINHYEKEPRLTNFRMPVYYFKDMIIFGYEGYWNDFARKSVGYFNSGFFVHVWCSGSNYFINTSSQFGNTPEASADFEGSFPINDMSQLSSIIYLNESFFPTKILRISNQTIVMGSELIYKDFPLLDHERVFFFNIPEYGFDLSISSGKPLEQYLRLFEAVDQFSVNAYPRIKKEYYSLPLWIWAGAHDYLHSNQSLGYPE